MILFGILVGVLGARFLPLNTNSTVVPTPTETITPTSTVTPTVNPTDNWQTYSNDTVGISFRYPQTWTINKEKLTSTSLITDLIKIDTNINVEGTYDGITQYSLRVYFIPDLKKQQDALKAANQTDGAIGLGSPKEVVFGDNKFTEIGGSGQYSTVQYGIQAKKNNQYVVFDMIPGDIANSEIQNTYNMILSTFKLTETSSAKYTCPSNGWVDCMPVLDSAKTIACSSEAMSWYKANCPDFQGAAL